MLNPVNENPYKAPNEIKQPRPKPSERPLRAIFVVLSKPFGIALIVALLGNLAAILAAAVVLREPPGSAIRPMDVPLYFLAIAVCTAIIGFPFVLQTWKHVNKIHAVIATALCLTPLFAGLFAFRLIVELFDYTLKP